MGGGKAFTIRTFAQYLKKHSMRTTLFSLAFIFCFIANTFSQFGTIDSTFNEDGKSTTKLYYVEGNSIAIQNSGRILVAGNKKDTGPGYEQDFYLTRFYDNGLVDNHFGTNGITTTDMGGEVDNAFDMTIQKDGKILLAGHSSLDNQIKDFNFVLARYTLDGILDSSFANNGKILRDSMPLGHATSVTTLNDNKILAGGVSYIHVYNDNSGDFDHIYNSLCIAKYNSNGTFDRSFANNGLLFIDYDSLSIFGFQTVKMVVQQDGKILIAGSVLFPGANSLRDIITVRVTPNGIIDSSFGLNGVVITDLNQKSMDNFASMLLQDDQKIIVVANTYHEANTSPLLIDSIVAIRYENNGKIDSSFGKQGKTIIAYNNKPGSNATSSLLLHTGQVLIAGYSYSDSSFLLTALNNNGITDSSFGTNGFTITSFKTHQDPGGPCPCDEHAFANDLAINSSGKIILGGVYEYYQYSDTYYDIALARYNGESVLPITLSSFTATKKQSSVLLNWQTASETNNNYFSIERSDNNSDSFKEMARVSSKGNSAQTQQYSFEDFVPLNGVNYYRLKQVDNDGEVTTSKIVLVDFAKVASLKLYPNPVKNILNIEGLAGSKTTLSIIDVNGKVLTSATTVTNTYNWNIKALPPGNYYLRIETGKKITSIKFVKG